MSIPNSTLLYTNHIKFTLSAADRSTTPSAVNASASLSTMDGIPNSTITTTNTIINALRPVQPTVQAKDAPSKRQSDSGSGLSAGAITGIVIGIVILLCCCCAGGGAAVTGTWYLVSD
ncbi:unnamed protein product [Rotaria sp. Silwood2]|nr:unnamed protein product [Rotaria sp. Silwood2]CAF4276086.1 unnamed protein product [Rotaria sp. Silwood2]